MPSAHFLWGWNPRYLMRRLAVIALEDVGLANLDLAERYLTTIHPILSEGRLGDGECEKVIGFVRAFCISPKSRFLTRIEATVHYSPHYQAITAAGKDSLFTKPLADALGEKDVLVAHAKAMACKPRDLADAIRDTHPQLVRLMAMGMKLGDEGLSLTLFATRNEKPMETVATDLPPVVTLGNFPTFVYDKHTRIGARALRLFVQQVPELASLTPETAVWVAYRILFRLESGLLDRETMFSSEVSVESVWWTTLCVEGLTLPDVFTIRDSLHRRIPVLNAIRRELLGLTSDNSQL